MTKAIWISAVGVFLVAEMVVLLAFWKIPNDHLFPGLGTKYFIAFIVALPAIAGVNGYYSVRRRLSSGGNDVMSELSVQFLFTIITAYTALIVSIGPLTQAMLALPK